MGAVYFSFKKEMCDILDVYQYINELYFLGKKLFPYLLFHFIFHVCYRCYKSNVIHATIEFENVFD